MTYLIPDDWYANHGLAPGDARRPQLPMQRGLVPTPPLRGVFGRPVVAVRRRGWVSPYDVPDSLGSLGAESIADILGRLQKDMKEAALKQAAISTGISIGLTAVPVLGWAAGAIYAVVQAVVSTKYQKEAQQVMADTERKAKEIVAGYELKLAQAQNRVFEEEQSAALQMAISCDLPAPMSGMGGWDPWEDVKKAAKKVTVKTVIKLAVAPSLVAATAVAKGIQSATDSKTIDRLTDPIIKADRAVDKGIDTLSGKEGVLKAEQASAQILADVRRTMQEQYDLNMGEMAKPEFRANLRLQIARNLRADPSVDALVKARCGATQRVLTAAGVTSGKSSAPVIAAAAAAAMLFLGGKG